MSSTRLASTLLARKSYSNQPSMPNSRRLRWIAARSNIGNVSYYPGKEVGQAFEPDKVQSRAGKPDLHAFLSCRGNIQWRSIILLYRAHEQRNFFPRNYL